MTLPSRPVHIPAGLTIDESTRVELLDAGKANRSNVNVRQNARGALDKRLGYAGLTKARIGGTRAAGSRLFVHEDTICTIDGTNLDAYAPGAAAAFIAGRVPEVACRLRACPAPGRTNTFEDLAYVNGYLCAAQLASGNTLFDATTTILDATTFAVVSPPATVDTDVTDICMGAYGTYFVLVTADASGGGIAAWYLNTASVSTIVTGWVSIGAIAADYDQGLALESLSTKLAIAYVSTTASRVTVKTISIAGVLETLNITATSPVDVDVAGTTGDTLWVAWTETTLVKILGLSTTTLATTTATAATVMTLADGAGPITVVPTTTAAGRVFCNTGPNPVWLSMSSSNFGVTAGAVAATGVVRVVPNTKFVSRGFYSGGRVYLHVIASDYANSAFAIQQQVVLVDATGQDFFVRPVACPTFNLAVPSSYYSTVRTTAGTKPNVPVGATSTKRYLPLGLKRGGFANAATVVEYDFAARARWQSVAHQRSTFLSGGLLSVFDGSRVTEAGFLFRPPKPTKTTGGTGQTATVGWRYVCVYEDMDAAGNWNQSGVSDAEFTGAFSNKTVTVTTQALAVSSRFGFTSSSRVAFYRTTDGGQAPYYLVATKLNDPTLASVTLADTMSDAILATQAQLYGSGNLPGTNGAGQDRRAPCALSHLVSYADMLVGSYGSTLYYSAGPVEGEGAWFSPEFLATIPGTGDITGLAAQDGTLYVFKSGSVYAIAGESPSDSGSSGGFGSPRRLACDVGCIEPDSLVVTSSGIFFRSARGIEILTRSGVVAWIGEQIQSTLADFPVLSSATLDDHEGLVYFTLAAAESGGLVSGEGRDLVFDLTVGGWMSVDDKRGTSAHEASQDSAMVSIAGKPRFAWLGVDGTVRYEKLATDSDAYLDGSSFVTSQYELPPLKLGLQQEQRVFEMEILFERHSAAGLLIEVANDFGAYDSDDNKVWTEAATLGERQLSFRPRPRGEAVQLRVSDSAPAILGTGQGFTFVGISADIAPKQGPTRATPRLAVAGRR